MTHDFIAEALGLWSEELNAGSVIFRIALSIIFSAIIGCERSSKRHSAGLRTFVIVSLGCTVAMITDLFLSGISGSKTYFLSAAAVIAVATTSVNSMIFSSKNQIKGLTTSVGLWCSGVIGLCCGAGFYTLTAIAFIALISTLALFPSFEKYLKDRSNHFEIHLELKSSSYLQDFVTTIRKLGLIIDDIELNPAYANSGLSVYSIAISITKEELRKYKTHRDIIEALRSLEYIYFIEEMHS